MRAAGPSSVSLWEPGGDRAPGGPPAEDVAIAAAAATLFALLRSSTRCIRRRPCLVVLNRTRSTSPPGVPPAGTWPRRSRARHRRGGV